MRTIKYYLRYFCSICVSSCAHKVIGPVDDAAVLHENEDQLTNVIIYDVFTPPVACADLRLHLAGGL